MPHHAERHVPVSIAQIPAPPWKPPDHTVSLTRLDGERYYMDRTEVTVKAYRECVDAGVCTPPAPGEREPNAKKRAFDDRLHIPHACPKELMTWYQPGHDDYPINCVNFSQAWRYCRYRGGRLPNTEEWDNVARGTGDFSDRQYPWPGDVHPSCRLAVISNRKGPGCGTGGPLPVGSRPKGASPVGALDMVGNVEEIILTSERPSQNRSYIDPYFAHDGIIDDTRFAYAGGSYAEKYADISSGGVGPPAPTVGFRCVYYPNGRGDFY